MRSLLLGVLYESLSISAQHHCHAIQVALNHNCADELNFQYQNGVTAMLPQQ